MVGIYHFKDLDGWTSAAIMKMKYPDIKLIGYDHYLPFNHDLTGEDVIIADITLPDENMIEISCSARSFTWIDHHASNIKDYDDVLRFKMNPHIKTVLTVGVAACELTWMTLFPNEKMPRAVQYAGEADVFRRNDLEHWENVTRPFFMGMMMVCNSINDYPSDILSNNLLVDTVIKNGIMINKYQDKVNASITRNSSYITDFEGLTALCINGQPHSSIVFGDTFDVNKHDVMIMYHYTGNEWKYSIYTTRDDLDCSKIAKKYGGGGHQQASGFRTDRLVLTKKPS